MEKKRTLSVNGVNNELIPPQPPSSPKIKNSLNNIENNECNNINNINNSGINNNNNNTSTNINKNINNSSEDIDYKDNHQQKYYLLPSKMSSSQEFQSYITPNKSINNRNNRNNNNNNNDDDNEGTIQNFTSRIFNSILMYMIRPFLVGASASFGISIGYVLFDICHNKLKLKWEGK
ncbi:hypothetical protein ACTFIV_004953 [Dictyostelium citrinum]